MAKRGKSSRHSRLHKQQKYQKNPLDPLIVFFALLGLRLFNAAFLATFFQPDEYFQSLEPAWQLAFGSNSSSPDRGAWLTWEWKQQLRSSLHPLLFAAVYRVGDTLSTFFGLSTTHRTSILLAAPKVLQAFFATCTDFYTWRLAERIYGHEDWVPLWTLAVTALSPWQWFCSTRTLSNSLETTLTVAALAYWPWEWTVKHRQQQAQKRWPWEEAVDEAEDRVRSDASGFIPASRFGQLTRLCTSYSLAAFATILRPTNVLIWLPISLSTLWKATRAERRALIRQALICGILVVAVSILSDRFYYGTWTFPPLRFLQFNIYQNLAVFYGRNRASYYVTEGLPLLLTTHLPFSLIAIYQYLSQLKPGVDTPTYRYHNVALCILSATVAFTMACFSLISHKEVRFIYPLLPVLHVLGGETIAQVYKVRAWTLRFALVLIAVLNLIIAVYVSGYHQRGVLDVMEYLRHQHEAQLQLKASATSTVAFLMPCHSTPWRSHLIYPGIEAWALTCEPPINVPLSQRDSYLDEADVFYLNPSAFLKQFVLEPAALGTTSSQEHVWPEYLVFFEALEAAVRQDVLDKGYKACWRGFNSHWHDDWRRKGDVMVFCRRSGA